MDQTASLPTPVLTATALRGQFSGLLGELRISQTFVNQEAVAIEAVFTFPVPLDAVLLGVKVRLNGRELAGQILAKRDAEDEYEDAIASGDRAILLQSAGPGRYTVNVGQLQAGEGAELEYRYAMLGVWDQACLRLLLPTTLAPRYGDPVRAGLAAHQVPGVSLAAEHRFSLSLGLGGVLATARVKSPSHAICVQRDGDLQRVMLASETAPMDRDLVLAIHADPAGTARRPTALVAPDGEGAVVWLSGQPELPKPCEPTPRDLVLVVDCSGSMAGTSMAQTRQALQTIIERLLPSDRINLIAFGSAPDALFSALQPADASTRHALKERLQRLDADLGGTELGRALTLAFQHGEGAPGKPLDILLITDGEVWGADTLIDAARRSVHRLFTVGVGAAVAEDLVRGLAEATKGACLLVHPNEAMAERILRHFERLRAPRAELRLHWPQPPQWNWPEPASGVFAGDTLHRLAGFAAVPEGELTLVYQREDGQQTSQRLALQPLPSFLPADVLPRLAAAKRLETLPEAQAKALALQHQLVSVHTHFILRDVAEVKAAGLPELRQVEHMLAAGWGGLGTVDIEMSCAEMCYEADPPPPAPISSPAFSAASEVRFYQPRTSPRPSAAEADLAAREEASAQHQSLRAWLLAEQNRLGDPQQPLPTLDELAGAGVMDMLIVMLQRWVDSGTSEEALVAAVLHLFLQYQPDLVIAREATRRLRFHYQRELTDKQRTQLDTWIKGWCAPERDDD
ncbi:marine proteobacterial sortase target protein [Thiorhodovibrio winogradskyi]|uniref:Marine proteobacterial sortase target protein n=1 Tax=Thiorhodovibrio winogradskyi TaxID=77007 RepID=A0ABZ0SAA8_9GAMM|nr:VIT and VWA domain-containing protein [Thiorhodovibrio winogradskyi]